MAVGEPTAYAAAASAIAVAEQASMFSCEFNSFRLDSSETFWEADVAGEIARDHGLKA